MSDAPTRLPRPSWADLSARSDLSMARRRVLETIESADEPMTAAEVADSLDLHHNTVREHLDSLVEAGFVEVSTKPTGRRGRPALRYASTAPDPAQVLDSYLTLLDAIADTLGTGPEGQRLAREIGRRWAQLTPLTEGDAAVVGSPDALTRATVLLPDLSTMGFAPDATGEEIILKACPLVTKDRVPHPLVCLMHEGFLNEVLAEQGRALNPANDAGARTRLSVVPLVADGCHVLVSDEPASGRPA